MAAWDVFGLHPAMVQALARQGFTAPTPIQEACLMPAINGRRDIIGAAQTVWLLSQLKLAQTPMRACLPAASRTGVPSSSVKSHSHLLAGKVLRADANRPVCSQQLASLLRLGP